MMEKQHMHKGDIIEGQVVDIAFGGEGVVKTDGAVVFVPFVALGENVRARIVRTGSSFYRAEVVQILSPSKQRQTPPCPYFTRCGGCAYQHLSYDAELEIKQTQLRDLLQRVGKLNDVPLLPMQYAEPYGYRNRISVHQEGRTIGFRGQDGRTLIDVEKCLLASDDVNAKLAYLRKKPGNREHYSLRAEGVADVVFEQTNALMAEKLVEAVKKAVGQSPQPLVEGYAGNGFFTRHLTHERRYVVSVETSERAVALARKACPAHVQCWQGTCEELLAKALKEAPEPAVCLVDPPREGLSQVVVNDLNTLPVARLVYLSCNPATLSRDLQRLSSRWKVSSLQPLDMFPRTAHLECLARLELKS